MTSQVGRAVQLLLLDGTEYTLIAALKTKSITFNKEPVDITSDDDAGWRKLLDDTDGQRSLDISVEGILKTNQVGIHAESQDHIGLRFLVPTIRQYTGTFAVTSYEVGAETAEGTTFSASFQSSGAVVFEAAGAP